jgi:arylsulfatase A-like enzyme
VPHFPVQEEEKWVDMYANIENECRRKYAASMTHMDDGIGQILAALRAEYLEEETLVIYFSDNGGQEKWGAGPDYYGGKFQPCDRLGDNCPLRGWKGDLYEGGIRVPAVVYWQGKLKPMKVTEAIGVQDFYPTLANVIRAKISNDVNIEGIDIWNVLSGGTIPQRVLYWRTEEQFAVRKGDWKLVHNGELLDQRDEELFDLSKDPYEQNNLIQTYPDKVEELQKELLRQMSQDHINLTFED